MAAKRYCCMQSDVAVKQLMQHGVTKDHLLPRQCGIESCIRHYKSAAPGLQYYITRLPPIGDMVHRENPKHLWASIHAAVWATAWGRSDVVCRGTKQA